MTHHSDMHARYVELTAEAASVTPTYITFDAPYDERQAPRSRHAAVRAAALTRSGQLHEPRSTAGQRFHVR